MRIAYVCADQGVPVFGGKGCSVHVQEMLRAFLKRGDDVTVLATRFDKPVPPGLGGITAVALPRPATKAAGEREQFAFVRNQQMEALLRRQGSFDLLYERFALWSHGALEFALAHGIPSVVEVNAPLIDEQSDHRQLIHRELAEESARRAFAAVTVIVAVSEEVAAWVRQVAPCDADIRVVPNGVCPRRFSPAVSPQMANEAGQFTVGFVGSLRPWHGVNHLLDAYLQLHRARANTRLLIVGDGPQGEHLRQRIAALPASVGDSIHLAGAVAPADVPPWLTSMQVAVAPYADSTNFYFSPLKVFEYMAAGRAVVASRVGQLEEVLQHGRCGLLTEPGDTPSLAGALVKLHDQPELVEKLGSAARAAVIRCHTWDGVAEYIHNLAIAAGSARHAARC